MESRLLQLPEDIFRRIIHVHLLSDNPPNVNRAAIQLSLVNKEAIRLSLVSKVFLTAVQTRPVLIHSCSYNDRGDQELKYMLSTLTRYHEENIHLDTFRFTCFSILSEANRNRIDKCIELAATKNLGIKNLNLYMHHIYFLPKHVFEAESLVRLELKFGSLQKPGESMIMWPKLKSLTLSSVAMEEGVFEDIIRGCPLIEFLTIDYPSSYNPNSKFKVSNLVCLKKLVIRSNGDQTIELDAVPNLECLDCSNGVLRLLSEYEYRKLKTIMLSNLGASFNGDFLIDLAHQFPALEELTLSNIELEKIHISSPSLKTIKMNAVKGLQEASFDVPNVVLFTFKNRDVPTLSFAGNSDGWTSCITLRIDKDNIDLKLKDFFAAITMPESSIHIFFSCEIFISLFIQPRAQKSGIIQDVTILTRSSQLEAFARKILDGVCPRRIMIKDGNDWEIRKIMFDHMYKY